MNIKSLEERGIYTDLLRKFRNEGHEVFVVSPIERRYHEKTQIIKERGATLLQIKSLNFQKTNLIEKGIGTLIIEYQYLFTIKKYFSKQQFDLILYSTPPITFSEVIKYIKTRDNAYSYLLLKDIFPQNAVDMGFIRKDGFFHRFFLKKEHRLYAISDTIGCMSKANKNYVLQHNTFLSSSKVEVNPNTIEPQTVYETIEERLAAREKYFLPMDAIVFVYGGNLGAPQGIDFLLKTIKECKEPKAYFIIVGSGTEFKKMEKWFNEEKPANARLLNAMLRSDFNTLLKVCDVGMIFLNPKFTIPNFPSRLLSYLEFKLPVIAATDKNTDIGEVIEQAGCGFGLISEDLNKIQNTISKLVNNKKLLADMSVKSRRLLESEYTVDRSYRLIKDKI